MQDVPSEFEFRFRALRFAKKSVAIFCGAILVFLLGTIVFRPLAVAVYAAAVGFGASVLAYLLILLIYFAKYSLAELIIWFLMINTGVALLVVPENAAIKFYGGLILDVALACALLKVCSADPTVNKSDAKS
jgi:hypothetical protein